MNLLEKIKLIINHPDNSHIHLPSIERMIDLYLEKTGDSDGYKNLLENKEKLEEKILH